MLSERSEFILFSERSLVFSKSYAATALWFFPAEGKELSLSGYEDEKPWGVSKQLLIPSLPIKHLSLREQEKYPQKRV